MKFNVVTVPVTENKYLTVMALQVTFQFWQYSSI